MAVPLLRLLLLVAALLGFLAALPAGVPRPDAIVLLLVPLALQTGRVPAAWFGFAAGLLLGCLGPGTAGVFAGVYGLTGVLLGSLTDESGSDSMFMTLLLVTMGTVAVGLLLAGVSALTGDGPAVGVLKAWLPRTLVVNLLLAWPFRTLYRVAVGSRAFMRPALEL